MRHGVWGLLVALAATVAKQTGDALARRVHRRRFGRLPRRHAAVARVARRLQQAGDL